MRSVLVRRNHASRRIARRIQDQEFRFRSDGLFNRGGFHAETVFRARLHVNRRAARVLDDVRKAHPIRRGDDHLVACLHQHAHHIEDAVLSADGDDAFLRRVIRAQFALVPRANRFAQRHDSRRRRVLRLIFFDRLDRRLLDVLRSREVRLARAEVGDVHALRFQPVGLGDDRRRRRDLYAIDPFRELHALSLWDRLQPVSSLPSLAQHNLFLRNLWPAAALQRSAAQAHSATHPTARFPGPISS